MFYLINSTPTTNLNNSIMINWHSLNNNSYVVINNVKYYPNNYLWSTKDIPNTKQDTTFYKKERYINNCFINNLLPNTLYEYYISDEINRSNNYYFKTSGSNITNLMLFSDLQCKYNEETHILYNLLKQRLNNNINICLCSGDLTDCGGSESEWLHILDKQSFHDSIIACSPGDHEYWADDLGSPYPMYDKPYAYNVIFNNPHNGIIYNTNYYFSYNNILFVSFDCLDSNHSSGKNIDKQIKWFIDEIIPIRNKYKFIICLMHKSINGSKIIDSSVYKNMHDKFDKIFIQAKVNLVLSGHDHIYSHMIDNNIHYLDMGSSGNKRRPLDESFDINNYVKLIDLKKEGFSCGAYAVINNDFIKITVINNLNQIIEEFNIQ